MTFKDWTDAQVESFVKELETEKARRHEMKKKAKEAGKAPSSQEHASQKQTVVKIGPRGGQIVKDKGPGGKAQYLGHGDKPGKEQAPGKKKASVHHVTHTPHHGVKVKDLSDEQLDKHLHEARVELFHRRHKAHGMAEQASKRAEQEGTHQAHRDASHAWSDAVHDHDRATEFYIGNERAQGHGAAGGPQAAHHREQGMAARKKAQEHGKKANEIRDAAEDHAKAAEGAANAMLNKVKAGEMDPAAVGVAFNKVADKYETAGNKDRAAEMRKRAAEHESKAASPEGHAKSEGHVGFFESDGEHHELFTHEGDLYSAPVSHGMDKDTGRREGAEWQGMAEHADKIAKERGIAGGDNAKPADKPALSLAPQTNEEALAAEARAKELAEKDPFEVSDASRAEAKKHAQSLLLTGSGNKITQSGMFAPQPGKMEAHSSRAIRLANEGKHQEASQAFTQAAAAHRAAKAPAVAAKFEKLAQEHAAKAKEKPGGKTPEQWADADSAMYEKEAAVRKMEQDAEAGKAKWSDVAQAYRDLSQGFKGHAKDHAFDSAKRDFTRGAERHADRAERAARTASEEMKQYEMAAADAHEATDVAKQTNGAREHGNAALAHKRAAPRAQSAAQRKGHEDQAAYHETEQKRRAGEESSAAKKGDAGPAGKHLGTFQRNGEPHKLVERDGDLYSVPESGGEEEWEGMAEHADKIAKRLGVGGKGESKPKGGGFSLAGQTPEQVAAEAAAEEAAKKKAEDEAERNKGKGSASLFKSRAGSITRTFN